MTRYVFIFAIILALLASCSRKNNPNGDTLASDSGTIIPDSATFAKNNEEVDAWKLESYLTKELPDTTTIQTVTSDCAVLIYPTDDQIDELTRENGEEDFATIADDSNYYQSVAIDLLDSAGIKTVTASRHYLKFVGKNNSWLLDIRKKGAVTWGIILFNTVKQPEVISAIDLTKEHIEQYFDRKP